MRGQSEFVTAILVLSAIFTFGIVYYSYSSAGNVKFSKIEDFSAIVQTKALSDYFRENYVNQSLLYSSWQKSYELANEGGGFRIWNENKLNEITFEKVKRNLEREIRKSRYFMDFSSKQCEVNFREPYKINITKIYNISFEFNADKNAMEFICRRNKIDAKYYLNVTRDINSSGNRFFHLFFLAKNFTSNLNKSLNEVDDPSGIFLGIGVGPDEETSKEIAKETARFIAETTYRRELSDRIFKEKMKLDREDMKIYIENYLEILTPDIFEHLKQYLPDFIRDLNEVKEKIASNLEKIKMEIESLIDNVEVNKEEVKKKIKEMENTGEIRDVMKNLKKKIDDLFEKSDIFDRIAEFKNSIKGKIDGIDVNNDLLREDLRKNLRKNVLETKDEIMNRIMIDVREGNIVYSSSESEIYGKRARFSDKSHSKYKINWSEIERIINDTNFSGILDDFKERVKNETKRQIKLYLENYVEKELINFIERNNLSYNISIVVDKSEIKEWLKGEIDEKIKKKVAENIALYISDFANRTINETVDKIKKLIEQEINKSFSSANFSLNSDVMNFVKGRIEDESIKRVMKDIGDYIAEYVKERLKKEVNREINKKKEDFLKRIDEEVDKNLEKFDNFSDSVDIEIKGSLNSVVKEIINRTENAIYDFIDDSADKLFRPVEEKIEDKLIRAEELKPLILLAINKSLEAKFDSDYFDINNYSKFESHDKLKDEVINAIEDGVRDALKENVEKPIEGIYANINAFPEEMKEELKNKIDRIFNKTSVFDLIERKKEELKNNVDNKFEEINELIDNFEGVIDKVTDLFELEEKVVEILRDIDDKIDEIIRILELEAGKAFKFEFFDEKVLTTIPIPPPFCPPACFVSIAQVRLDPEELNVKVNVKDEKYVLPVSEGYRNLEFRFTYKHIFEGNKDNPKGNGLNLGIISEIPVGDILNEISS